MRTTAGKRLGVLGVLLASAALAGVATPAMADDKHRRGDRRDGYKQYDPYSAGTLRIGDRRFTVRSDVYVNDEIMYLFRQMGYEAWTSYGKVYVRVGYSHRPRVRWKSGSYRVKTWYEGDCLVIKAIPKSYRRAGHRVKAPHRPAWDYDRGIHRGPWRSGPRHRRPYPHFSIGLRW